MAFVYQGRKGNKAGRNIANLLLGPANFMTADEYNRFAKEYAGGKAEELAQQYGDMFSEDELLSMLMGSVGETPGFWTRLYKATPFGTIFQGNQDEDYVTNIDSAVRDLLAQLQRAKELGDMPEVSLDAAMDRARSDVDAELGQQEQALADLLNQQRESYNTAAEQILSSDYQKNASLMGTYQSEMRRAQRNALEAGASAGARLANNINVTLSTQNRQAQQSLETSNNLAQMLLNQRQAASDIGQQRVGLRSGYTERVNSLGQQYYNDDETRRGEWEDRARTTLDPTGLGNSNYTDAILNRHRSKSYTSNASGKPGGTVY